MLLDEEIDAVIRRRPGQYARQHARSRARSAIAAVSALGVASPAFATQVGWHDRWSVVVAVAAAIGVVLVDKFTAAPLDPWLRGMAAENVVGQILAGLAPSGWLVLNGVQIGRTDIDHVAVGPGGVVTIETKSRRGWTRASRVSRRWLQQAGAHRRRLVALAPDLDRVDALLVLHAPTVEAGPTITRGVCVLPAGELREYLLGRPTAMSNQQTRTTYNEIARKIALNSVSRNCYKGPLNEAEV